MEAKGQITYRISINKSIKVIQKLYMGNDATKVIQIYIWKMTQQQKMNKYNITLNRFVFRIDTTIFQAPKNYTMT